MMKKTVGARLALGAMALATFLMPSSAMAQFATDSQWQGLTFDSILEWVNFLFHVFVGT